MENNLENKERFFVLYWGQKVLKTSTQLVNVSNVWNLKHESFYLELTPLSEISDEDAIEISMIFSDNQNLCKELHADRGRRILNSGKVKIKSIDYLRSKGYALPYMDLSVEDLINYGWIKLRTNGK